MDTTISSVPQQHFTFASPVSKTYDHPLDFTFASPVSETHDHVLEFDYGSWIQQSKSGHYSSRDDDMSSMEEATERHNLEMALRAAEGMSEEAYEPSLRDITEPPMDINLAEWCPAKRGTLVRRRTNRSWRKRLSTNENMEDASFIARMFMPSPSGARGREKHFVGSTSTVPAVQKKSVSVSTHGDSSMDDAASETGNGPNNKWSNSIPSEHNQDKSYNRKKSMGCYPFFSSDKRKVKQIAHVSM